jgi:hypothetical protein
MLTRDPVVYGENMIDSASDGPAPFYIYNDDDD